MTDGRDDVDEVTLLTHHPEEVIPLLADPNFATAFVYQHWELIVTLTAQVQELQDQLRRVAPEA